MEKFIIIFYHVSRLSNAPIVYLACASSLVTIPMEMLHLHRAMLRLLRDILLQETVFVKIRMVCAHMGIECVPAEFRQISRIAGRRSEACSSTLRIKGARFSGCPFIRQSTT